MMRVSVDSVGMEHKMELISLWRSVESRLKMLDIITVRVLTVDKILLVIVWVVMCSHSDKESYKTSSVRVTVTELILQLFKHYHSLLTHRDKHSNYTWAQNWVTSQSAPLDCDLSCAVTSDLPATLGANPKMNMLRFHFLCLIVLK